MLTDSQDEVTDASPAAARAVERRSGPRWEAVSRRARVAWRSGSPPYPWAPARLIDISEQGAQLLTDGAPSDLQEVWVRLDRLPSEWVRATVRAMRSEGRKPVYCNLHVAFREPCPAGLFDEAVGRDPCDGSRPSRETAPPPLAFSFPFEGDAR